MCIICVSKSGVRQPDENTIRTMFRHNPHGAGYMVARDGRVIIHKGFMIRTSTCAPSARNTSPPPTAWCTTFASVRRQA